jgi:hypothetical protein
MAQKPISMQEIVWIMNTKIKRDKVSLIQFAEITTNIEMDMCLKSYNDFAKKYNLSLGQALDAVLMMKNPENYIQLMLGITLSVYNLAHVDDPMPLDEYFEEVIRQLYP